MENLFYFCSMRKLFFLIPFFLVSCEKYVTEISDLSLSGRYVVSQVDVINSDGNNQSFIGGQTYVGEYPHPFNNIQVNNFYILFDGSGFNGFFKMVRLQPFSSNLWLYGNDQDLFFSVYGNTSYSYGYLVLTYTPISSTTKKTLTFRIEEDGLEHLKLLSTGINTNGGLGPKSQIRLYLQREHP